jgi:hypothetical protein
VRSPSPYFPETGDVPVAELEAEAAHLGKFLGTSLSISVQRAARLRQFAAAARSSAYTEEGPAGCHHSAGHFRPGLSDLLCLDLEVSPR